MPNPYNRRRDEIPARIVTAPIATQTGAGPGRSLRLELTKKEAKRWQVRVVDANDPKHVIEDAETKAYRCPGASLESYDWITDNVMVRLEFPLQGNLAHIKVGLPPVRDGPASLLSSLPWWVGEVTHRL
jgi:hypothetical protein